MTKYSEEDREGIVKRLLEGLAASKPQCDNQWISVGRTARKETYQWRCTCSAEGKWTTNILEAEAEMKEHALKELENAQGTQPA